MVMIAVPDIWAIAAIPLARIVDVAIMLAVPSLEMTIMVAPPVAIAAIFGAAPPAHIGFAFAESMLAIAFVPAIPSMPMTFVMAARAFAAATVIFAMVALAIAIATMVEPDCGDRIKRIEQNRIHDGDAAIFVRAAGVTRDRARGRHHDERRRDRSQQRLPSPESAHRLDALGHGNLP